MRPVILTGLDAIPHQQTGSNSTSELFRFPESAVPQWFADSYALRRLQAFAIVIGDWLQQYAARNAARSADSTRRLNRMTTRITTCTHRFLKSTLQLAVMGSLVAIAPIFTFAESMHDHNAAAEASSSKLVREVRNATQAFLDVNN